MDGSKNPSSKDSDDQIPSAEELKIPILEVLSDGSILSMDEVVDALIKHLNLPESIMEVKTTSGKKSVLKDHAEHACSPLNRNHLITFPEYNGKKQTYRQITALGLEELNGGAKSFFEHLTNRGLEYCTQDVENFLLSLKAKQFVILSGGTGTGKTRLAKEYGLYISKYGHQGERYAIVTVGSNWTDNRHILGYKNAISGKYKWTASLKLMVESNKCPDGQYLLILDEMNLSHVERYFSDVISCMESGEPICLDSDGSVPDSISLGDNLFVVGTVNMDETTYTFSPKVLDRANVLEFETPSVDDYLKQPKLYDTGTRDVEFLQNPSRGIECRSMNARELIEKMGGGAKEAVDSMIGDLASIQAIMSEMGLSFAHRTIDEVMRFMYVSWKYEGGGKFANWERYMDAQIRQKILPKVHGNVSIKKHLESLRDFCMDKYNTSAVKLDRMIKVLDAQRYVTFNC